MITISAADDNGHVFIRITHPGDFVASFMPFIRTQIVELFYSLNTNLPDVSPESC